MHVYLIELNILSGERSRSRSSFKVKCQIYGICPSENFNIGHKFLNIDYSNLIFGMHVYLMKLHILSGGSSRSRSSFKVKGKKINKNKFKAAFSWSCKFWVVEVQGQGHLSRSKVKKNIFFFSKRRSHEATHFEWWKVKVILQGERSNKKTHFF